MNDLPFRVKKFDLLVGIMRKEKHGVYVCMIDPERIWLSLSRRLTSRESPLESTILTGDNPLLFY